METWFNFLDFIFLTQWKIHCVSISKYPSNLRDPCFFSFMLHLMCQQRPSSACTNPLFQSNLCLHDQPGFLLPPSTYTSLLQCLALQWTQPLSYNNVSSFILGLLSQQFVHPFDLSCITFQIRPCATCFVFHEYASLHQKRHLQLDFMFMVPNLYIFLCVDFTNNIIYKYIQTFTTMLMCHH